MRFLWVWYVVLGCKANQPELSAVRDDGCLALPNVPRGALQGDPKGNGLYWFERVIARNYDGSDISFDRLVHYDLQTRQAVVIKEPAIGPLHFTKDGEPLVIVKYENRTLVQLKPNQVQSLTPDYFDVTDFEITGPKSVALLAGADSKWSVFTLDLDRPRPTHLIDADTLLSASRGLVFVRAGETSYVVDVATGAKESREVPRDVRPDREHVYFVGDSQVKALSLRTGEVATVVEERRDWTLIHQASSVLARAGVRAEQHAYDLANGTATALPVLRGGTSIVGTTRLGDQTWALIGHNTSNYDGDLWTITHEADVCLLDTKVKDLEIVTRTLPARYAARESAFWEVVQNKYPGSRWQILDVAGDPPTLSASFTGEGGNDLAKLRARAREVHKSVTSLFADDELRTEVYYEDGRLATYRWRRDRLRGRAYAGIGDVALTDPADFDLDLSELVLEKTKDNRIACRGKLTSLRSVTLLDLRVRCIAGDQTRAIAIAKLEPTTSIAFSQTFAASENDYLVLEVFQGRDPLVVRDTAGVEKDRTVYDFFVALHADTRLALRTHTFADRFYVQLEAHPKARLKEVDLEAVKSAYVRIADRRALFDVGTEELELQIYVERKIYNWDGEQLTLAD